MPAFHLPDETGALVGLDALLADGPVVVLFHRGHWCPYCRIAALAMARRRAAVEAAGGRLVAILPEPQAYAARLKAQAGARYPFLSDIDNGYALSISLVFWIGQELRRLYRANGNDDRELPGQRRLDAADPRDLRRAPRRAGRGALRRSRLPPTHGHRGRRRRGRRCALGERLDDGALTRQHSSMDCLGFRLRGAVEIYQIRYFLAIAEELNFTRASEKCNVSQPSLSRAIQLLEAELGGLLVHREHKRTHLTELGHKVLPHLEAIYDELQTAKRVSNDSPG